MGSTTTFRLRMRTTDTRAVIEALTILGELPIHDARRTDFDWDIGMPARFDRATSFSDRIPTEQPDAPTYWRLDGDILTLCLDLINPSARHDDGVSMEIGEPSRESILLDALSAICVEPEGVIVGGWQAEYSDDWAPLVSWKGRVVCSYVPDGGSYGRMTGAVVQHEGIIDPSLLAANEDDASLVILPG